MEISKDFFENNTYFKIIGQEGFCLYSYILYISKNNNICRCSVNDIITFFTFNYDNRSIISYGKKKTKISLLKDKKTVIKYLKILIQYNFINFIDKTDNLNHNCNYTYIFQITKDVSENSNIIDDMLFETSICNIGCIGWSLLCLLNHYQNINLTKIRITDILDKYIGTTQAYLNLLEKQHLIKEYKSEIKLNLFTKKI